MNVEGAVAQAVESFPRWQLFVVMLGGPMTAVVGGAFAFFTIRWKWRKDKEEADLQLYRSKAEDLLATLDTLRHLDRLYWERILKLARREVASIDYTRDVDLGRMMAAYSKSVMLVEMYFPDLSSQLKQELAARQAVEDFAHEIDGPQRDLVLRDAPTEAQRLFNVAQQEMTVLMRDVVDLSRRFKPSATV